MSNGTAGSLTKSTVPTGFPPASGSFCRGCGWERQAKPAKSSARPLPESRVAFSRARRETMVLVGGSISPQAGPLARLPLGAVETPLYTVLILRLGARSPSAARTHEKSAVSSQDEAVHITERNRPPLHSTTKLCRY